MFSKKRSLMAATSIFVFTCNAYVYALEKSNTDKDQSYYYKQFQSIFEKIDKDYVQQPNHQEMTDEAINGMLRSLDPYSGYFTDDDLEFFLSQTEGEFGGIGVEIVYDAGAIKVISPIDDLPAYNAGIRSGDYIIGVNGELVSNLGFNKAIKNMRGEPGSELNLLILKTDETKPQEITLKRQIVKIDPIKSDLEHSEVGDIGYVRIVTFNNNTFKDLKKSVEDLEKKAMAAKKELKGIILDLRNNPGGLLEQAVAVSQYFLDHGIIVSTKGKNPKDDIVLSAGRFVPKAPKVPIVLLINAGSASCSEIVAGALQDHGRAIVVGVNSYGKGLVQTFTQVNSRAAVKLTTAKYYTPSGKSINGTGIVPDIYIEPATVEYASKKDKDNPLNNYSVKSYLQKYNNQDKKDDKLLSSLDKKKDKLDKKNDTKFNRTDTDIEKKKQDKDIKDIPQMSKRYTEDYQYARAFDVVRALIISEKRTNNYDNKR